MSVPKKEITDGELKKRLFGAAEKMLFVDDETNKQINVVFNEAKNAIWIRDAITDVLIIDEEAVKKWIGEPII